MADDEILEGKRPQRARLNDVGERDGLDYPLYQESSRPPDKFTINPEDGMPQQIPTSSMEDNLAPELSVESFICMADLSKFVVRDEKGYVVQEFEPSEVERSPDGRYWHVTEGTVPVWRRILPWLFQALAVVVLVVGIFWQAAPTEMVVIVMALFLVMGLLLINHEPIAQWIEVTPFRPQCEHYARQLMPWPDDPEYKLCTRYCSALKNEQGELFELGNSALDACEMRCPRAPEADSKIDEFDAKIILKGKRSSKDEGFDVDAELSKDLGVLGGGK